VFDFSDSRGRFYPGICEAKEIRMMRVDEITDPRYNKHAFKCKIQYLVKKMAFAMTDQHVLTTGTYTVKLT